MQTPMMAALFRDGPAEGKIRVVVDVYRGELQARFECATCGEVMDSSTNPDREVIWDCLDCGYELGSGAALDLSKGATRAIERFHSEVSRKVGLWQRFLNWIHRWVPGR